MVQVRFYVPFHFQKTDRRNNEFHSTDIKTSELIRVFKGRQSPPRVLITAGILPFPFNGIT